MQSTIPLLAVTLLVLVSETAPASVAPDDAPGLPLNVAIGGLGPTATGVPAIRNSGLGEGGFGPTISLQGLLDSEGSSTTVIPDLISGPDARGGMGGYPPQSDVLTNFPGGFSGSGRGKLAIDPTGPGAPESEGVPILSAVPEPVKVILSTLGVGGALFAYRARRRKATAC